MEKEKLWQERINLNKQKIRVEKILKIIHTN